MWRDDNDEVGAVVVGGGDEIEEERLLIRAKVNSAEFASKEKFPSASSFPQSPVKTPKTGRSKLTADPFDLKTTFWKDLTTSTAEVEEEEEESEVAREDKEV